MALKRTHDGNVRRTRAKQTHHDAGACLGCEHGWRFGRGRLQINARVGLRCKQPQPLDYVVRRLSLDRRQWNRWLLTVMAYSNQYSRVGRRGQPTQLHADRHGLQQPIQSDRSARTAHPAPRWPSWLTATDTVGSVGEDSPPSSTLGRHGLQQPIQSDRSARTAHPAPRWPSWLTATDTVGSVV